MAWNSTCGSCERSNPLEIDKTSASSGTSASREVYDSEAARTGPRCAKKSRNARSQVDSGETSREATIDCDWINCVGSSILAKLGTRGSCLANRFGGTRSAELLRAALHGGIEIVEAFEIEGAIGRAEIQCEQRAL